MPAFKVVITDEIGRTYDIERDILRSIDAEIVLSESGDLDDLLESCYNADGILCNLAAMPKVIIERLEKCKVISRYGVGYDNLDVETCTKKGIAVANVPDYCYHEVAEHTIALLMSCARSIVRKDRNVRQGVWDFARNDQILRINGKSIAFLGFGNIPRSVLEKIRGFGLSRFLVYDPFVEANIIEKAGAEKVDLLTAVQEADFVSVHLPYNSETKNLINNEIFDQMKNSAILINTSRGGVINEADLIAALQNKKIHAVGLDVYASEPLSSNSPLVRLENCILTDHTAFFSEESIIELKTKCAENVRSALQGLKPKYQVNKT